MELPDNFWTPGESYADKLASSIAANMERNAMLASEKFDRDLEQHDAIMSMADNFDQTVQDVSKLNETVSGIDNRLALLNLRIEELERKYETEKNRADEAEKKNRASDQRFSLWLTILSIIMPFAFTLLLIWLGVKLQ